VKNEKVTELLVAQELVKDLSEAERLIKEGRVLADGLPVKSERSLVKPGAELKIKSDDPAWVGRGGEKIWPVLEEGWLKVEGKRALDVGASTGGFTEALLRAGAERVYAVDVGYGQLAYKLQRDERVIRLDRYNFRHAQSDDFQPPPQIFVMDVSFISSLKLIDPLEIVMTETPAGIVLVKPQFEANKEEVGDGVIESETLRQKILERVRAGWEEKGWRVVETAPAPLRGEEGNQEYLMLVEK